MSESDEELARQRERAEALEREISNLEQKKLSPTASPLERIERKMAELRRAEEEKAKKSSTPPATP